MTKAETESFLRYMLFMYPNVKLNEQQFSQTVQVWANEFAEDPKDLVGEAFRFARTESPDWMPTVPRMKRSIQIVASRVKIKSKEQEFKDIHCGKTEDEWRKMNEWEQSQQGKEKLKSFKERLSALLGGKV